MSASKSRQARAERPAITAQPKSTNEQAASLTQGESGLSVDSDELATRFLSEATEQGNFESRQGPPELSLVSGAETDAAVTGSSFDPDSSVWERTIGQTLEAGEQPDLGDLASSEPPVSGLEDAAASTEPRASGANLFDDARSDTREAVADQFDDDERWRAAARTGRTL